METPKSIQRDMDIEMMGVSAARCLNSELHSGRDYGFCIRCGYAVCAVQKCAHWHAKMCRANRKFDICDVRPRELFPEIMDTN